MGLSLEPLIDFCVAEAAGRLEGDRKFAPFGAVMVGGDPKGVEAPGHIEAVEEELAALARGGIVRAVAVVDAVDLEAEMPDGATKAIRVHAESYAGASEWIIPYRRLRRGLLGLKREVETGDKHGERSEARFFA
ncbi:hypothetical protein [Sphingomicrobium sediminis]|uniref:Uncharacterized protein n=1 Tax=Sphingomicrobium sediminis TaxID=2950949 RepID=A0A9X2EH08_9SPHN|nr:hypothetical protein [Sphingomicrobium sediminis]MCM8557332.1 hypothetical protein [Sphingomicrobium sediminis]